VARYRPRERALSDHIGAKSHYERNTPVSKQMKREYDFSAGQRGKFYRPNAQFNLPVYLEPEIQARLSKAARKRKEDVSVLVNTILKREIENAEALS
jgi:hypothetical protein